MIISVVEYLGRATLRHAEYVGSLALQLRAGARLNRTDSATGRKPESLALCGQADADCRRGCVSDGRHHGAVRGVHSCHARGLQSCAVSAP
jgi:hypothetical protein